MEKQTFEFTLKFSGRKPTEGLIAAIKKLNVFPLWRNAKCKLINFTEYKQMIADGLLEDDYDRTYWRIQEGEVGIVVLDYYAKSYSKTWEDISNCKSDFEDGWNECEKKYKMLADWDEAIAHEKARKDWMKVIKRTFKIDVTGDSRVSYWDIDELPKHIEGVISAKLTNRCNGVSWITVEVKCSGEGMWPIMEEIGNRTGYWNHNIPQDPRQEETHNSYGWNKVAKKK